MKTPEIGKCIQKNSFFHLVTYFEKSRSLNSHVLLYILEPLTHNSIHKFSNDFQI